MKLPLLTIIIFEFLSLQAISEVAKHRIRFAQASVEKKEKLQDSYVFEKPYLTQVILKKLLECHADLKADNIFPESSDAFYEQLKENSQETFRLVKTSSGETYIRSTLSAQDEKALQSFDNSPAYNLDAQMIGINEINYQNKDEHIGTTEDKFTTCSFMRSHDSNFKRKSCFVCKSKFNSNDPEIQDLILFMEHEINLEAEKEKAKEQQKAQGKPLKIPFRLN